MGNPHHDQGYGEMEGKTSLLAAPTLDLGGQLAKIENGSSDATLQMNMNSLNTAFAQYQAAAGVKVVPVKKNRLPLWSIAAMFFLFFITIMTGVFFLFFYDQEQPNPNVNETTTYTAEITIIKPDVETLPEITPHDVNMAVETGRKEFRKQLKVVLKPLKRDIIVTIRTVPEGAKVYRGKHSKGTTPLEFIVPRGNKKLKYKVKLKGYDDYTHSLIPDKDRDNTIHLTKKRRKR